MIVVSNTTPLNCLVLLKKDHILPVLFATIVVTPAVVTELSRSAAPGPVQAWILSPPPGLHIQSPRLIGDALDLGKGESEAIALAEELHADRVLLDDAKARRIAMA